MEFREFFNHFHHPDENTSGVCSQPVLAWVCLFLTDPYGHYEYKVQKKEHINAEEGRY